MTVLSVVQNFSMAVGITRPSLIFGATTREGQELQALVNRTAAMIAESFDWQKLRKQATVTGDGVAEDFALPGDYGRMLKTAKLWSSRHFWSLQHVVDSDDWLAMQVQPTPLIYGCWTIFGDQIHIRPVMAMGETVKFFYITANLTKSSDGTGKGSFTDDTDTFVLSERLLELALIYMWKQVKGQDFSAELADFEIAAAKAFDMDGGSKPKLSGNGCVPVRHGNVWPGTVSG